jgi:DNA-binding winged helix-turn-helix (wHTH) protein/TolB-like protein/cytochrome c-type biogenesis protein CcmH/NrfG
MPRLKIGDWTVDRATNEICRGSELVHLEPKVADLLIALAQRADEVVSREELLAQVWSGVVVGEDVLTQGIIKLRKALGDNSREPVYIQTIPKRGYRLIAPVAPVASLEAELESRLEAAPEAGLEAAPDANPVHSEVRLEMSPRPARVLWVTGAAAIAVVAFVGYWQYSRDAAHAHLASPRETVESIANSQLDTSPKVIVYPFKEVTNDPLQTLLARGITARLITDLGRFPEVRVISMQDSASPAGARPGNEAKGGDYVVRGELQRSGDNIRLYVRLTDATSGESLWSEQYDRAYTELLSLQDELTREVLGKLRIKVSDAELRRKARPYTRNLQAYEYFLRAQSGLLVRRKPDNDVAREMYLKAIELDPTFARARAGLALTYAADRRNGWTSDGAGAVAKALELATSARQMDPDSPEICFALAYVNMEGGDLSEATDNLREALRLNPSYADAYALMGGIQTYRGRPQETIPLLSTAMRLSPEAGSLYFLVLGRAYFFLGDTESASLYLREALARNSESVESHVYLAATLAVAGHKDEASWEAVQVRTLEPAFNIREWLRSYPMADAGQREHLTQVLEGLKL